MTTRWGDHFELDWDRISDGRRRRDSDIDEDYPRSIGRRQYRFDVSIDAAHFDEDCSGGMVGRAESGSPDGNKIVNLSRLAAGAGVSGGGEMARLGDGDLSLGLTRTLGE